MRKKLLLAILILLLASLAVAVAADIRVTQQIQTQIAFLPQSSQLRETWDSIVMNRMIDGAFSLAVFVAVLVIVWKIGPQKEPPKRISQKEAQKIAEDLEQEYRKNGVYVLPAEDAVEEDLVETLDIPVMKSADYGDHCVKVIWYPVKNADGYSVWRKAGNQRWVRIARLRGGDCTYSDYHLDGETRYSYTVKAFAYVDGKQIVSKKDPLGVDVYVSEGNIPEVPKISKRLDEEGREYLTWTKVPHIKVYRILRKAQDGEWTVVARVSPSAPHTFRDETAQPGEVHCYSVSAHRVFDGTVVSSDFDEDGIQLKA